MDYNGNIGGINLVGNIYITMMPLILAGIINMVFTKTKLYRKNKCPIDLGKNFIDGKRLFGDNKTYIGFISMILFCIIFQVIWSIICKYLGFENNNELYFIYENTIHFNILIGFLFGFTYMICELPNSFIKRRINIMPGKTDKGIKGIIFFVIDQIDSLIGVFFVLMLFNGMSLSRYLLYLFVGALTHISINLLLYGLRIRRNF